MSKLPIPHIINTIKTKLGFDRAMTAPGEDVVDAVNKQSQQIGDLPQLKTTAKTSLVNAVNEVIDDSVATSTGVISKHPNITSGMLSYASCSKKGNIVQVSGRIYDMIDTVSSGAFFVIPEGFRPFSKVNIIAYMYLLEFGTFNAGQRLVIGSIDTNGVVSFDFSTGGRTDDVYFACTYSI